MPSALFRRLARRLAARLRPHRVPFVFDGRYVMEVRSIPADPRRGEQILTFLSIEGLLRRGGLRWPRLASLDALRRVHTEAYLDAVLAPGALERIFGLRIPDAEEDRLLTLQRAMAGGTVLATRLALSSCRPAVNLGGGLHHAHADRGQGFCIFNDVAVAIAQARSAGFAEPIAVIDLDLHDGDGTRSIFAPDATVHTFSIHNQRWDEAPALASTSVALGGGVEDEAYLEALHHHLPPVLAAARPGLVYYLAGCDTAADDALGNWRISAAGLLARDRFVVEAVRAACGEVPLVILLAGGYGTDAWRYSARFFAWLLSGGLRLEPPTTDEITLKRYRYLASFVPPSELSRQPGENELGISWEDLLPGTGASGRKTRFLGFYSTHGLELALERYGFLARLRAMGFAHPALELDLEHPAGETLRLWGDDDRQEMLVELRVRRDRRLAPGLELLFVEWLLLQNPRLAFSASRRPLPGQKHPGLGLLRDVTSLLVLVCDRVGLDGLAFVPSHYHLAVHPERTIRFLDAADEGRFRALQGALAGLPLPAAAAAVEGGRVVDRTTGEVLRWRPAPMVLPVSARLQEATGSAAYNARAGESAASLALELRPSPAQPVDPATVSRS